METAANLWTRWAGRWLVGSVLLGLASALSGCGLLRDLAGEPGPEPAAAAAWAPQTDARPSSVAPAAGTIEEQDASPARPGGYQVDRAVAEPAAGISTPAVPAPRSVRPISLPEVLTVAGVDNPTIGLAEQAVRASLALQMQARVLLVPNLLVGADYDLHNGALQSSFGAIRYVNRQSVYVGLGDRAFAAETVSMPGVRLLAHLGDACYEPQVASRVVRQRQSQAEAARNDVLLDVAVAYLRLLGAEGRLAVLRQSRVDFAEIARLTRDFAETGKGREGDAERARADLLLLEIDEQRAQEDVAVASAELARLLSLDPSERLAISTGPVQVVQLIDPQKPLPELLQVALRSRPELRAVEAQIATARLRVSQEKLRPFLPTLSVGYSAGGFGGGATTTEPSFGHFRTREDFDVIAWWTLQNAGLGNWALVKRRRAELGQALGQEGLVLNQVGREVADAYNLSAARLREVDVARRQVATGVDGLQRDLIRIRGGEGLPIEVLNSAKLLAQARQELLRAIVAYDEAQFRLFVALGQPPTLAVQPEDSTPGASCAPNAP